MKLKVLLSVALIAMIVAGCTTPPNGTAIVLQYPDDAETLDTGDGSRGVNTTTVRELKVLNNTTVGGTLTVTGGVTGANVLTTGNQTVAGIKTLTDVLPANAGITVDTTAFTVADTSGNVATTGTLLVGGAATFSGAVAVAGALNSVAPVLVKDATYPLTADDSGSIIKNTAAAPATFTLPSAAAGLNYCFYNYSGNDVIIDPFDGTDTILKLTNSAGDSLTNTTAFDVVCLTALDATNWGNLQTGIGTWADGN